MKFTRMEEGRFQNSCPPKNGTNVQKKPAEVVPENSCL